MKREDLFLAIAAAEDDWLLQSEDDISKHLVLAPPYRKRISKAILVAAVTVTMLALTACTAIGFLFYETPLEMLDTFFGTNTKYTQGEAWHVGSPQLGRTYFGAFERYPLDEKIAESLEKEIHPVGQSITWNGYTLTVDGYLYDSATGCGIISYAIVNEDIWNISSTYRIRPNGALYRRYSDGEMIDTNLARQDYIVSEKTNKQKLTVASYFYNGEGLDALEIHLSCGTYMSANAFNDFIYEEQMKISGEVTLEEMETILQAWEDLKEISPDSIVIGLEEDTALEHIQTEGGEILISPIALTVQRHKLGTGVNQVIIIYDDGTEFIVKDSKTNNFFFRHAKANSTEVCYLFNRLVDIHRITSVRINDTEFTF